jgi:hypothetical protein
MSAAFPEGSSVEALRRVTSAIAQHGLTLHEAEALEPLVRQLLDEIESVVIPDSEDYFPEINGPAPELWTPDRY